MHRSVQPGVPSHSSLDSVMPLPHTGRQSESSFALEPGGQHLSLFLLAIMVVYGSHMTLHFSGLPDINSVVQGSPSSGHSVGHSVSLPGSQVSPSSFCMMPSPHLSEQSESVLLLQSGGQQSSSLSHETMREKKHSVERQGFRGRAILKHCGIGKQREMHESG